MCNCTDRLSALPDDVLCHILSYIPTTKSSMRTSILAKRWRFLWANVPLLDFECILGPYGTATNSEIINHVLLHHKSNITTFRLVYTDNDSDDYEFESWIATIIARKVHTLTLDLFSRFKLPRCLFTCKTLVDLSLASCGVIPMGGTIYFPALKRLSLAYVGYEHDDESLPHLLSGCPVLEELSIRADKSVPWWCLSLPKLIRLQLKLTDSLAPHCYNNNNEENGSLIEADVNFNGPREVDENFLYLKSVMDFLGMLSNVKFLKLTTCGRGMGDVPADSCFSKLSIVKFHNLIKLNVVRGDWWFIISLLENADQLRVLTITKMNDSTKGLMIPKQVPRCLMTHLETVNIKTGLLRRWTIEFEVAKYFLENAKV